MRQPILLTVSLTCCALGLIVAAAVLVQIGTGVSNALPASKGPDDDVTRTLEPDDHGITAPVARTVEVPSVIGEKAAGVLAETGEVDEEETEWKVTGDPEALELMKQFGYVEVGPNGLVRRVPESNRANDSDAKSEFSTIVVPKTGTTRMRTFHPGGSVEEDYLLVDGLRSGHSISLHVNGRIKAEEDWISGVRCGSSREYSDHGEKVVEGSYRNDLKDGLWTTWWRNGLRESEGEYEGGKMRGVWRFWKLNGEPDPEKSGTYENGRLEEPK